MARTRYHTKPSVFTVCYVSNTHKLLLYKAIVTLCFVELRCLRGGRGRRKNIKTRNIILEAWKVLRPLSRILVLFENSQMSRVPHKEVMSLFSYSNIGATNQSFAHIRSKKCCRNSKHSLFSLWKNNNLAPWLPCRPLLRCDEKGKMKVNTATYPDHFSSFVAPQKSNRE